MEVKIDINMLQLSVIADSEESPEKGFGLLTTTVRDKYKPFFNHLNDYLDNAIQAVPEEKVPGENTLTQDNFADITVFNRISILDLWHEMLDWGIGSRWKFRRYLIETCRAEDMVPYIVNRFPNVYVFEYEVIDPDITQLYYYVGIRSKQTGNSNNDPDSIIKQTEYHKKQEHVVSV